MVRLYRTLCIITTLWIICSCGDSEVSRSLNDIESYILERPDSALVALRAIDKEQIGASKERAKYSLLYAMTLDKNYIDTTDVSIIQPAIDYYERTDDVESRMKANYYLGCIYLNGGDTKNAIFAYTKALDLAGSSEDARFKALIHGSLSLVFSNDYLSETALKHHLEAIKNATEASDARLLWILQGKLGKRYAMNRERARADSVYNAYMSMPVLDSVIYARNLLNYSYILVQRNPVEAERSIELFNLAKRYGGKPTIDNYYSYAYALEKVGKTKEADRILTIIDKRNKGNKLAESTWKYKIYKHRKDYKKSLKYYEETLRKQDSIIIINLRHSLYKTQGEYFIEKTDKIESEKKIVELRRNQLILLFSVAIFILLIVLMTLRNRSLSRIKEISLLLKESGDRLKNITTELSEKDSQIDVLSHNFLIIYKSKYQNLNRLCASYLAPSGKAAKDRIYDEVKDVMEDFARDKSSPSLSERMVNKELNGIMDTIRQECGTLSEAEFRLISLFIMGFEAKTISLLTNYTVKSVYGKKDRIKKRIAKTSSPFKEEILRFLA